MNQINIYSNIPLYQQLYEILHQEIIDGIWKPGEMIPPESELMETYHISRITVRKVFDLLAKEGLIYRKQGRGTFVAHPTLEHGLSRIVNFTEDMRQRGFEPSTRVLFSGLVKATAYIAEKLQLKEGEELAQLNRLRFADDEPMCLEKSFLVHRYCFGILKFDFSKNSLREIKAREFGIKWIRAKQAIRAINASQKLAELLSINENAALLYFERISYSQQNIPVEYLRAYYRADRYTLYNELQGGAG